MIAQARRMCSHCGNPMRGTASISNPTGQYWLCHPDEGMDCYHLVTVWRHEPTTQCTKCVDPKEMPWLPPL